MQGVAVLLLSCGAWVLYCGGESYRPIRMAGAILKNPAGAGNLLAGAKAEVAATRPTTESAVDSFGTAAALTGNGSVTIGQNPWAAFPVTAPYGQRNHGPLVDVHQGIDYGVPDGTPLPSLMLGTAHHTSTAAGGNILRIDGSGPWAGWSTFYDHVKAFAVADGAQVGVGVIVADSGGAAGDPGRGDATGAHLHFEVHHHGLVVNPASFFTWELGNLANLNASTVVPHTGVASRL